MKRFRKDKALHKGEQCSDNCDCIGLEEEKMDNRYELNKELAQMLKGGVIMDVTTPQQAQIAQETGACAVMALERIPADIRAVGGVSRMSDPKMIQEIQNAVSIPVMAKCRIGHFVEAQILEAIEIDYIDESEILSPADAALMMQLGAEGVFVGSGIFKSGNPVKRASAIVKAVTNYRDGKMLAELSKDLGEAMVGINEEEIKTLMEERGKRSPWTAWYSPEGRVPPWENCCGNWICFFL